MHAGEIGFTHITAMSRTADVLERSDTACSFDEGVLLPQARENTAGRFFYICRHARHAPDPKGFVAEQAEQVENRSLRLNRWQAGSYLLSGVLDAAGGATLRAALEPLAKRAGKDVLEVLVGLGKLSRLLRKLEPASSLRTSVCQSTLPVNFALAPTLG